MLKKIALVGIFAVMSVVSFGTSTSNANATAVRTATKPVNASSIAGPTMKGMCPSWYCL
jgi:hypothetical protein